MSLIKKQNWISLQQYPIKLFIKPNGLINSKLYKINDSTFMVTNNNVMYNIYKQEWIIPNNELLSINNIYGCCYNAKSKEIFIANEHQTMQIFNIHKKNLKMYNNKGKHNQCAQLIFIDNHCHIIGGIHNNIHQIWNYQNDTFTQIHAFTEFQGGRGLFGLIYLKKKNQLLLLGGFDYINRNAIDAIHKFSFVNFKWTKIEKKLPMKMVYVDGVTTKCEQFVILLGANTVGDKAYTNIYILKLKKMTFIKTKINAPSIGAFRLIIMENMYKNKIIINGFIRKMKTELYIDLPSSIIMLIQTWHIIEYIHIIHILNGKHWKINIDKLFENIL